MHRPCTIALVVIVGGLVGGAVAADKKPLSLERMGQLLTILRSDLNEDNRAQAAQELSRADGAQYPEVASYLIEALRHDPKPAVRSEALESLVRLRPITAQAGKAIDAAKEDASFKVRWKARTASRTYHAAGYQDPGSEKKPAPAPAPPKTASSAPAAPTGGWLYKLMAKPSADPARTSPSQTQQPPLADPFPGAAEPVPAPSLSAPIPVPNPFEGLKSPPAAPQPIPAPVVPKLPSKGSELGPDL
jgi:hypothetical protein